MITVSDTARAIIDSGSFTYQVKASSWLGDVLLADDVPIANGREETDRTLKVPERVILTVPKYDDLGNAWTPTTDTAPLAANGQTLKISLGIGIGNDGFEWFQRGEFLIQQTRSQGESLEVTAVGLLYLVQEAGFVAPFQPSGTVSQTLRALIEPAVQVNLDNAPADEAVPSAINWDTDRIAAVYELLDAWPATARMHPQGYLEINPVATPTEPVAYFTDATGGTVVSAAGSSDREGGFNVVVVTGTAGDGSEVRGLAYMPFGPWVYGIGSANPLPVPFAYASPLLTSQFRCEIAAATILARKMREGMLRRFTITAVLDPTLQIGDAIELTTDDVSGLLCTIEAMTLPYRPDDMVLEVVSTS